MTISIITVCYNSAATIRDTLESVRAQTGQSVQHIVIDGASTDGTPDIVREYQHVDRLVCEPDRGLYDAMNKGIRLATGDVIGILNSDDYYPHHGVLAAVGKTLDIHQTPALYGDLKYVHPLRPHRVLRYWRSGYYTSNRFRYGWMPPHPAFFVRRECYERLGDYDISFRSAADYELMLRFLYKHRLPACYLPEVLVHMRSGGRSGASLRHRIHANREDRKAWLKNGLRPAFFTLWIKPIRKIPQYFWH